MNLTSVLIKEILLPVHNDPQPPLTFLRTEFIKLRRLVLAKERLVVIVVVEIVVVLDGINVEVVQVDVADLLLSQREVSHEGPCHAPFHAPALAHIEPAKYHSLFFSLIEHVNTL